MKIDYLSNGLRVLYIPNQSKTVGISFIGKAGALYGSQGLAHFLEHTVLCATEKYPNFLSLANTLDNFGIFRNAYTSHEHMRFVFKCLPEHMESVFDFLSEVTIRPLLLESDIEKQKKIISQEINRQLTDPQAFARVLSYETLYGKTGLGIPVLGTIENILKINRDDLLNFFRDRFTAENFTLVICGDIDFAKTKKIIETHLGKMPKKNKINTQLSIPVYRATEKKVFERKDIRQAILHIMWKGYTTKDNLSYAAFLLKTLLVDGRLSRLWQSLRQTHALAYSVNGSLIKQESYGNFSISTGLDPVNIDFAIDKIMYEINDLSKEVIDDNEFNRIKEIVRTSLIFSSDSAFETAEYYATKIISDDTFKGIDDEIKRYDSVTKDDIRKVASDFIKQGSYITVLKQ